MKQRFLATLTAIALFLSIVPAAFAAEQVASGTCGDNLTWVLTVDGTLTISGEGAMDGPTWTNYGDSILKVVIEDGVTTIGDNAFHFCTNLTSVTIPDSVTVIGQWAFSNCDGLTSVTVIELGAFCWCTSLTSMTIPDSVTEIGQYAFSNCTNLNEITFCGDAPYINEDAFYNVTAVAYYPADNDTWTKSVMQDYGGSITWKPYTPEPENPFVDVNSGKFFYTPALWAMENGITNGVDEAHFAPYESCTRGQVVTFLWRVNGSPEPKTTASPFSDVTEGKYYTKAVLWAAENGITTGNADGTFAPNDTVTRASLSLSSGAHWVNRLPPLPPAASPTFPATNITPPPSSGLPRTASPPATSTVPSPPTPPVPEVRSSPSSTALTLMNDPSPS